MNPNKRLTIVGKFRLNDDKAEYRFTNRETPNPKQGIYPLNSAQFFETVQPALCFVPKDTNKTIGDTVFNAYRIMTPLKAQQENRPLQSMQPLAIKPDSPFFNIQNDPNVPEYHAIQKEGGRLFEALLTDLNQVARFYQGPFSKALLKLAKEYLLVYANQTLTRGSQIKSTAWYQAFLSHPNLTTTILKYLTAYPEDVVKIQQQFEQDLQKATEGQTHWTDHGDEYRKALSQALERCRKALESGHETLTEIANQQADMRWLVDYIGSEYDISKAFNEAAKDFAHYYRLFREHSDNVHRFLRSGPLHSFLFCWLASKYAGHTDGKTLDDASEALFKIGVEEQGKKRIIAESQAEWRDTINTIRQGITFDKLSKEDREKITNPDLYQAGSEEVGTQLIKSLETSGNFTRKQLRQRCENLFVETALLMGDAMGDILKQFNDRFDDYMVLYHAIIRQKSGSPDEFKQAMQETTLKAIAPPVLNKIMERLFADLAGIKECTAQPVKQAFLKVITEDTQGEYFKAYVDKQKDIDAASLQLRETYRARLMEVDATSDNASQIGLAGVAALHHIPDIKDKHIQARQEAQIKKLASEVKQLVPFQTTLPEGIPSGDYQIVQNDTVIGTATVDDKMRENTVFSMSGHFDADQINTVKTAEQIIAVSKADQAQRFTWKRTDYAVIGKSLNAVEKDNPNPLTFKEITLHQFEGEMPNDGEYQLLVEEDQVGEIRLTTTQQKNTVPTIAGTMNTDHLEVIASDESLTLRQDKDHFDWQAKARKDLVPIVRDYPGLRPAYVANEQLCQQLAKDEQQFDKFVKGLIDQDDLMMRLHTLVLGEYMLAAPEGQVTLDTADLSKMSGLIFDLVRYIGNSKVKALFENKPSVELLDDPGRGLKAINLSQYYPVSTYEDLNTVLQYHYAACNELLSMQDYLRDIAQLRRTFDLLKHDNNIEIMLINQTLEEHVNCTESNHEVLLCNDDERDHHALFVYLTAQSDAQNGLESLKALLPGDIGVLSQTGWHTQLPLFVTTDKTVKSDAFPVISRESIALPDFSKLKGGIQGIPLLELCLSLMTTVDYGQFGEFLRKIHTDFVKLNKEVETAGIPEKGQSIYDYLKTLWFTHPTLRSNLIFLKWFNLGLQAKKQGNVAALGTEFGAFLNNHYSQLNWDQAFEGLEQIDGQFPLKNFKVKLEPLCQVKNDWNRLSNLNNPPAINAAFGFSIVEDNTGKAWPLVGIDWKNGYQDHI